MKNNLRTKTLFADLISPEDRKKFNPKYTLKEYDTTFGGKEYKSLYLLYMESVDEYDFIEKYLEGTAHFEALCNAKWFRDGVRSHRGIEAWREDMRARDASRAKKAVMVAVSEGDTAAAKKLWDMSKPTAETKRGRFVKEEAKKEAVKKVEEEDFLADAALRLNVVSIRD